MAEQWVYDFADGSREMRDLLGGKGANVAEMTRILGVERVPAGFTVTTEACVAYMKAGDSEPDGMAEQVADALARLEELTGKGSATTTIRSWSACARGRASRCRGCSTRCPTSGSTTSRSRGWRPRRRTSASRGTPTGASCRCSATWCTESRARRSRTRSRRRSPSAAWRPTWSSTPARCAS